MTEEILNLNVRTQTLGQDAGEHTCWQVAETALRVPAAKTALLLCDVWDKHWCRGASERVDAMVPRMNEVVRAARATGVHIIHAPSGTMAFYAGTPARQRMLDVPRVEPPPPIERPDPPLPIDDSDHGSDTGETTTHRAWSRQHAGITIEDTDGISDNGIEVYSYLKQNEIEHLLIMGVHTNMCVLGRSFAIKQMVRWGIDVVLVRDLTDTMYNPAMRPYVSHAEGTRLVVGYIEKFWCPTIESGDLA